MSIRGLLPKLPSRSRAELRHWLISEFIFLSRLRLFYSDEEPFITRSLWRQCQDAHPRRVRILILPPSCSITIALPNGRCDAPHPKRTGGASPLQGPELAWSFETALALPTRRFDRTASDRPAAISNFLVVHSSPEPQNSSSFFTVLPLGPRGAFRAAISWSTPSSCPCRSRCKRCSTQGLACASAWPRQARRQLPQVFAPMIEIQELPGSGPPVLGQIPNPGTAIGQDQHLLGAAPPRNASS